MEKVTRKYGLLTGIALVMGTVIGCGVFIKLGEVLKNCNGSLSLSLLAWLIGGLIMVAGGFCFAIYATRVEKFNGCVDYIENASNRKVGYYFGYYLGMIYFPVVTSHVAFVAASYLIACFTTDPEIYELSTYPTFLLAIGIVTIFFLLNFFAPKIAHKFQVSVLFVKLAPLILIVIVGLFAKLINPNAGIINAFTNPATGEDVVNNFGDAIKITSFAYDGWICAAAFNAEMKDSKKNLPKAIIFGTIAVIIIYLLYFIGASAIVGNQELLEKGGESGIFSAAVVFNTLFGGAGTIIALVLMFISCLGNTNVMLMTTSRTIIAMGYRNEGFMPQRIAKVKDGEFTLTPYLFTYLITIYYVIIWFLALQKDIPFFSYLRDMDSISCALPYGVYIIVYIYIMRNFKEEHVVKRYVMPVIAIIGSAFFTICGMGIYQIIVNHDWRPLASFGAFAALSLVAYIPGIYVFHKHHQEQAPNNI
ncbi:MAG: APC family permease [Bacilli bacterium]|nr:APC family permease [Bacilli bacterium]